MFPVSLQQILIRDSEGGVVPFDPRELKKRIETAFCNSHQESESYVSDDIVTALEYTLKRVPKKELIFNCGEIDSAVIRILESAGFPEAAKEFRSSASEQLLQLSADREAIGEFLSAHLGCSVERLQRIAEQSADALKKLEIASASPHLLIELARHYERELAEKDLRDSATALPRTTLPAESIVNSLPEEARRLVNAGVLKISGISAVFPGIRFQFSMEKFSEMSNFTTPVTELELHPALYQAGKVLENCRECIQKCFSGAEILPCLVSIPDMFEFLTGKAGCTKADKLAAEVAGILCSELKSELYQLSFE